MCLHNTLAHTLPARVLWEWRWWLLHDVSCSWPEEAFMSLWEASDVHQKAERGEDGRYDLKEKDSPKE